MTVYYKVEKGSSNLFHIVEPNKIAEFVSIAVLNMSLDEVMTVSMVEVDDEDNYNGLIDVKVGRNT